jgi:hypothetical protein
VARERFVGRDHFIRLQQEYPAATHALLATRLAANGDELQSASAQVRVTTSDKKDEKRTS